MNVKKKILKIQLIVKHQVHVFPVMDYGYSIYHHIMSY